MDMEKELQEYEAWLLSGAAEELINAYKKVRRG